MDDVDKGCAVAIGALFGAAIVVGVIGFAWAVSIMLKSMAESIVVGFSEGLWSYLFLLQCFLELMKWFLETFISIRI